VLRDLVRFEPRHRTTDIASAVDQLRAASKRRAAVFLISDLEDRDFERKIGAIASFHDLTGPHRVARWRDSGRCTPLDVWVELVPFAETRSYIRRTLFYSRVYQRRLGRAVKRLSEHYAAIPPAGGSNTPC